jgi:hypothetical protein
VVLGTPQLLEGFWTGEADLALTAYLTLLVLALLRWLAQPRRAWLIQAMVFGAAAGLTKYEGLFRVGVVLAAFSLEALLRRRPGQLVGTLCVGVAAGLAYLPWAIFRATHGIEVSGEHLSHLQLGALGAVLVALIAALGGLRTGGGIVVAVLSWAIARQQLLRPLILVTLGQLAATLLAFLVTDYSPVLQVQLSATRLFEQFLPVALFASGVWLTENL